jgi:hypothetical protein
LLAPTLRSPQRKASTPQYVPGFAAHTGHSATNVDSEREMTAQASAELSATFLPRDLQAVINAIESGFQSLRGDIVELRTDMDSKMKSIAAKVSGIDAKVAGIDARVSGLNIAACSFRDSQLRVSGKMLQTLSTISDRLGIRFDGFNAACLPRMLAIRGHPDALVERGVMVPDPERTVHSNASMVELDLFCKDPLVLVEATTFLGTKEFNRLQKGARLGALIEKCEAKNPEMLFCTFGVHPRISNKIVRFCSENNI